MIAVYCLHNYFSCILVIYPIYRSIKMQKKFHKIFKSFLVTIPLTISISSHGQSTVLDVVFTWEPYGYLEEGKPAGYEIEIFSHIATQIGVTPNFINLPWKRCLHMMKTREADILISALDVLDRHSYMTYPKENISTSETALFTTGEKTVDFNGSLEQLNGLTIGTTAGFSYGPTFDTQKGLTLVESYSTEQMLKRVLAGSLELGIENTLVISRIAEKKGKIKMLHFIKPLIHSQKLFACFSKKKGHQELSRKFSDALAKFKRTEKYKEIQRKYGIK